MTTRPFSPAVDVRGLLSGLLDRGYVQATDQTMRAVLRNSTNGVMALRLKQFEDEASRLAAAGEKFTSDNPVFQALLTDFDATLARNRALLEAVAPDVQASGANAAAVAARQLTLPGIPDAVLQASGFEWLRPDPEAVARLIDYASRPAFRALLDKYQAGASDTALNVFLRGIAGGQGPIQTARDVRAVVEGLPVSDANTMARTLQLESYRAAAQANYLANADILEPDGIRIATLDDRTCPVCVELHGTPVPLSSDVESHWNCRCVVVAVVKGNPRDIQLGSDWFDTQSESTQRGILGNAAYNAWSDGAISLSDLVGRKTDPTFGRMVETNSLKGVLGEKAKGYYATQGR